MSSVYRALFPFAEIVFFCLKEAPVAFEAVLLILLMQHRRYQYSRT